MSDQIDINVLGEMPIFAGFKKRDLNNVAYTLRRRRWSPGQVIVAEGDGGICFFLIVSGTAVVEAGGIPIRTLGPGATFGETALLARTTKRTASVIAGSHLATYAMVSWHFAWLLERYPQVAFRLATSLAEQVQERAEADHAGAVSFL